MQEFMATSERRAELYGWFTALFSGELSDEQIAEHDSYDVRSFLKSLATLDPMRDAVVELNDAIARLLVRPDRQQALAADFAALFLAAPGQGARPCESLYRDAGDEMVELLARLQRLGVGSDGHADHLSTRLELMSSLIMRAVESSDAPERAQWLQEQDALLHHHLLSWFASFEQTCRAADAFGFYGACARLLGVFLSMDANYLGLARAAQPAG